MKRLIAAALLALAVLVHPVALRAQGLPSDTANYSASASGAPAIVQIGKSGGGVIDVGQIFSAAVQPWISEIVNLLIVAAVTWLGTWLRTRFKIDLDAKQRDALTSFAQNQAGALIAAGGVSMAGTKVNIDSSAMAVVINRAATRIPDAMKHFGLTPEVIAQKIIEAIPQVAAGAQMIAQAHRDGSDKPTEQLP